MAQRRMFSLKITDTDAFLEMPVSSQLLYFHFNMHADDDGFVSSPRKIMKTIGCGEDDLKVLLIKRYVLGFPSGIVVIKHWRMHNLLRKDRYTETNYIEEKSLLRIKENGAYTDEQPLDTLLATKRQPNGTTGKVSIGKGRKGKYKSSFTPPSLEEVSQYINEKGYSIDANKFYEFFNEAGWIDSKGNKVKSWKQKIITWNSYSDTNNPIRKERSKV